MEEIDPVIEGLKALPAPALDPAFAADVRRRARAALGRRPRAGIAVLGVAASAVAVYLVWLVAFLRALGT